MDRHKLRLEAVHAALKIMELNAVPTPVGAPPPLPRNAMTVVEDAGRIYQFLTIPN